MILVAALLAGPAAAFEVIKEGGPKARLLFLGLGSSERACGSIDLPEGAVSVVYDPRTFECGAYEQLVVIVRAPFGRGMAFIGELCAAILTRGSRLTLRATGATGHGAPEIVCSLQGPPEN